MKLQILPRLLNKFFIEIFNLCAVKVTGYLKVFESTFSKSFVLVILLLTLNM